MNNQMAILLTLEQFVDLLSAVEHASLTYAASPTKRQDFATLLAGLDAGLMAAAANVVEVAS